MYTLSLTFPDCTNPVICDNGNLRDKKFRGNDGIHLTPHGTSVFANNLKFKIAESLKISVVRKDRRNYRTENRNDRNGVYHNRSQYYNERRIDDKVRPVIMLYRYKSILQGDINILVYL